MLFPPQAQLLVQLRLSLCFHLDSKNYKNITALCSIENSDYSFQYIFHRPMNWNYCTTLIIQTYSNFFTQSFFLVIARTLCGQRELRNIANILLKFIFYTCLSQSFPLPFHFPLIFSSLHFFFSWAILSWSKTAPLFRQGFYRWHYIPVPIV